jgi:peroxiredoxin
VVINAKKNHDMAPNFSLTNATGKKKQLSDYLKRTSCLTGIVAVVSLLQYDFALQSNCQTFSQKELIYWFLTPELPDKSMSTVEKHELQFEVLRMWGIAAKEYGIVFKLTDDVAASYQRV